MITTPYRILRINGVQVLLCLVCDRWSTHPQDLLHHYCGFCHLFLDDLPDDLRGIAPPSPIVGLEQARHPRAARPS